MKFLLPAPRGWRQVFIRLRKLDKRGTYVVLQANNNSMKLVMKFVGEVHIMPPISFWSLTFESPLSQNLSLCENRTKFSLQFLSYRSPGARRMANTNRIYNKTYLSSHCQSIQLCGKFPDVKAEQVLQIKKRSWILNRTTITSLYLTRYGWTPKRDERKHKHLYER